MLLIKTQLPTNNLPIKKVMSKLLQSYIYTALDDREHDGYKHPNGKVFKSMNFKMVYKDSKIEAKYVALNPENEKRVAKYMLKNGLKLGKIRLSNTSVSLIDRTTNLKSPIKVGGFISCAIKDGNSKKKIYLEPKSSKFQEILHKNTLEKYEALFKREYRGDLKIELIEQKPKPKIFFYNNRGVIKAWYGVYKIEADKELLEMILNTGMGSDAMKGVGFVELLNPPKELEERENELSA